MRRAAAILLAGCLTLQLLSSSALAAQGPVTVAETEWVASAESAPADGGAALASDGDVSDAATDGAASTPVDANTADTAGEVSPAAGESASAGTATEGELLQETPTDGAVQVEPGTDSTVQVEPGTDGAVQIEPSTDSAVQVEPGTDGAVQVEPGTDAFQADGELIPGADGTDELTVTPSGDEIVVGDPLETPDELALESEIETEIDPLGGILPISADSSVAGKSFVEVKTVATQIFPTGKKVTVSLLSADGKTVLDTQEGEVSGSKGASFVAKFEVSSGDYIVRIRADKFAEFTQTIGVQANSTSKLEVCTAQSINVVDGAVSEVQRGWLHVGDVTGDFVIDKKDIDQILGDIRSYDFAVDKSRSNINDWIDQKVDLADLQFAVRSLENIENNVKNTATVQVLKMPQKVEHDAQTTVTNVEALFEENEETATLKPVNSGAISESNPVSVGFAFGEDNATKDQLPVMGGMTIKAPVDITKGDNTNNIASGSVEVTYVDGDGQSQTMQIPIETDVTSDQGGAQGAAVILDLGFMPIAGGSSVKVEPDGSLVLDFGDQVAVKKVTIKITGTATKDQDLVDIAKVEFLNDMDSRIPAPELNTPAFIGEPTVGNKEFSVSWTEQTNVTGYELFLAGPTENASHAEQTLRLSATSHTVTSINDGELLNFQTYTVKVRSVNGEWSSPWAETTARPEPQAIPEPVDNVKVEGGYRSVRVSWKDMEDADGYMVYYQAVADNQVVEEKFEPVVRDFVQTKDGAGKLNATSYTISGLENGTEYAVRVVGWNAMGWGEPSNPVKGTTESGTTPRLPQYHLINTSNGTGVLTAHIQSASVGNNFGQRMESSPLDKAKAQTEQWPTINGQVQKNAQWGLGVVDDDYGSYWVKDNEWDDGVVYPVNDFSKGITVTFDAEYEMNYLTFTAANIDPSKVPSQARIVYWNSETPNGQAIGTTVYQEKDPNGYPYFVVKFHKTVQANQIQMCLGTGYTRIEMKVAEMHFHHYDALYDEIAKLFADDMHATLAEGVTQERIDDLRKKLDEKDPETGELHPLYQSMLLELKAAEELLNLGGTEIFQVDNRITLSKDGGLNFSGLNAWQPLGLVAAVDDEINVYVGHNAKNVGEGSSLKLYFTQYHAQSSSVAGYYSLKVGSNPIKLKQLSGDDFEKGGQLYIAYEGNDANDQYAVRVIGGTKIPVLNVYKMADDAQRKAAISQYLTELEAYVPTIASQHEALHAGSNNKNVQYAYDEKNCFLNATDLMMDYMMYSIPATQVWASLQNKEDKVAALDTALKAMDQTMTLFYQHKGLSNAETKLSYRTAMPSTHLNMRYMRMFAGAFMYAAGNHIGIEYDSCTLAGAESWDSFGWGYTHEIGHDINDGNYAIPEITNNYFAQLLTMATNGPRWNSEGETSYKKVYEKVTSNTIGRASNVGVQLALYWQLHLAFDDFADRTIFDDYKEQFDNLFFARVDTYSRNPGEAKKINNVELKLDAGADQNLMRLSCAAAGANILPFFERWGMVPNADTEQYAATFGNKTEKALYYVNDSARDYRATYVGERPTSFETSVTADVTADGNQVTLEVTNATAAAGLTLGYEIVRSMYTNGKPAEEVIGFVLANNDGTATYVDTIASLDNRVLSYAVKPVDQFLNYADRVEAGSVKVSTGGALDKGTWTVETSIATGDMETVTADENNPDGGFGSDSTVAEQRSAIGRILDNDKSNTYHATVKVGETITVDMQKQQSVTSVLYKGSNVTLSLAVSQDKTNWVAVKTKYEVTGATDTAQAIWLDSVLESEKDAWIGTYDARYLQLTMQSEGAVDIHEIDICGPSGDNVEFFEHGIGLLEADYVYDQSKPEDAKIPAGSVIFTGSYKGNPAYNLVLLYDQDGRVIGASADNTEVNAEQIILANVPEHGNLGETSNGTWVYYVKEDTIQGVNKVRAELYRVDDANTLEGERVVSDTVWVEMPTELQSITITDNRGSQQ